MRRFFKFLAAITAITLLIGTVQPICFAESAQYADGVIVDYDFEKSLSRPYGFTSISGSVSTVGLNNEHGRVLYVQNTASKSASAYLNIGKQPEGGIYYVGYDVLNRSKKCFGYVAFAGCESPMAETDYLRPFAFMQNGMYSLFKNIQTDGTLYNSDPNYGNIQYDADRWYHIDNYIDTQNKMLYIYIDGELYLQTVFPDYFKDFCGIKFIQNIRSDAGNYYDNLKIYRMNGDIGLNFDKSGTACPDNFKSCVSVNFKNDTIGNIFFASTGANFTPEIRNTFNKELNTSVKYYALDSYNNVVWAKESEYKISPYGSISDNLNIDTGKLRGRFTLYAEFTDTKSNIEYKEISTRFTVIEDADGHNMRWGVGNHFDRNGGKSSEIVKILSQAGFGTCRVTDKLMTWESYESEKGVYKTIKSYNDVIDMLSENNMNAFQLLYGGNPLYLDSHPPYTDKDIAAFAKACANWAKDTEGTINMYEVWNEYDLPTFNRYGRPVEDYVKMLKAVSEAIKEVRPDAKIIGLSPSGLAWDWAKRAVDNGALDYCDYVSLHPYSQNMSVDDYNWVSKLQDFKKYCADKGYDDVRLVASEMGWSSASIDGDKQQAAYAVRMMSLNTYYDLIDIVCWYTAQNHNISTPHERNFGLLKYWTYTDLPYEAKDSLIAISTYNAYMNGAKALDDICVENSHNILRYTLPSGKQAIVAYALKDALDVGFASSAQSAEYIDMYGNKKILNAQNSKFNLHLSGEPIYLIADDFGDISACKSDFAVQDKNIYGNPSGKTVFKINQPENLNVTYKLDLMNTMQAENEYTQNGEHCTELRMPKTMGDDDKITVSAYDGEKIIYTAEIPLKATDGVKATMSVKPFNNNSDRWQAVIDIENTDYDEEVEGTFKVTQPQSLADSMGEIKINSIKGGDKGEVRFFLPEISYSYTLKGILEFTNGKKIELGDDYKLMTAAYADSKPVLDGVLSPNEWNENSYVSQQQFEIVLPNYKGADDLYVNKLYTMWDEEYLYIAADITDDSLDYEHDKERIWAGDSIQFAVSFEKNKNAPRTEIAFGIDKNKKPTAARYYFMGTEEPNNSFSGYDVKISRDDNTKHTTYEAKFPWDILIPGNVEPKADIAMYLSYLINENDTGTRLGWIKCGGGIDTAKDPSQFNEVHLLGSAKKGENDD